MCSVCVCSVRYRDEVPRLDIMISDLKTALENDNVESVRSIAAHCKSTINMEIERMAGNFQVKRDLFSETNNITDSIRSIVLGAVNDEERQNKMVGVGG